MDAGLLAATLLLQADPPSRGGGLSDAGGVLTVVGIAVGAILVAIALIYLVARGYRARRRDDASGRTVRPGIPSEEGRDFSSGDDR
jgi:hypothetical protein